jgi:hypothetical protein
MILLHSQKPLTIMKLLTPWAHPWTAGVLGAKGPFNQACVEPLVDGGMAPIALRDEQF